MSFLLGFLVSLFIGGSAYSIYFTVREYMNRRETRRRIEQANEVVNATKQINIIAENLLNTKVEDMGKLLEAGLIDFNQIRAFYKAVSNAKKLIAQVETVYFESMEKATEGTGLIVITAANKNNQNNKNNGNNNQQNNQGQKQN